MTTLREHYRMVFHAPGADEVINDLIGFTGRLGETERAGANALIARITRMILTPDKPMRPRAIKSNGGRIAHG